MPAPARLLTALALALFAAACATPSPEVRVRTALLEAGVGPGTSACMAERLVDRLSIAQLRRLASLAKLPGRDVGAMTIDAFLRHVRALEDPEMFLVVSRVGVGCAIAG